MMNKMIGSIFFIFLLITNINIKAERFGKSCHGVVAPIINEGDLKKNTIYKYVKKQFLIEKRYCDIKDSNLTICVRDNPDSDSCSNITLNLGDSVYLGGLNQKNPMLSNNNILRKIPLLVSEIDNKICLSMPTIYGISPLICKNSNKQKSTYQKRKEYTSNLDISPACYKNPKHSLAPNVSLSGKAVQCTKETLDTAFFGKTPGGKKVAIGKVNNFFKFQSLLSKSVGAFLVIYLIFFGIRILLNPYELTLNEIAMAAIKVILVGYFAIGVNGDFFGIETKNGMTDIVLPLALQAVWGFADMILSGVSSELCVFNPSDYEEGYKYYALWDSIDCRIGHYFGLNTFGITISDKIPAAMNSGLAWFSMQFYLLMGGNLILVLLNMIFAIFLILMVVSLVTQFLLCLLTIYVLVYVSPIFIPMCLFSRTNGYFTGWRNSLLSCTLQPAVSIGFILLAFSMFDTAIYKDCKFSSEIKQESDYKYCNFKITNPEDPECKSSIGAHWLSIYEGKHWKKHRLILFAINYISVSHEMLFESIYLFLFCCIFYYFSKTSSRMAAELTNGPFMDKIVDNATEFARIAAQKAKEAAGVAKKAAILAAKIYLKGG